MKKSLKIICVVLAVFLAISICGCKNSQSLDNVILDAEQPIESIPDTETIVEKSKPQNETEVDEETTKHTNVETPVVNTENIVDNTKDANAGADVTTNDTATIFETEEIINDNISKEDIPNDISVPVCTLTVRCDTILNNMDKLDKSKKDYIPGGGIIYQQSNLTFKQGETAFDILLREMRNNGIHFEFESNPAYKSSYVEGINNIYEFDCGPESGWMYMVNGKYPGKGSSAYELQDGDEISFIYTVSHGKDIGGYIAN